MSQPRPLAATTLLPDGSVLVLGAESRLVERYDPRLVERYDPATGKFTRAGSLLNEYMYVRAILLPNGKVLVVGSGVPGIGGELFDPIDGRSSSVSVPIQLARASRDGGDPLALETATLLSDGRVLLQVFDDEALVNYLITYDPATGVFTQANPTEMPKGWLPTSAVLLPDGRVFFAGGWIVHDRTEPFDVADSAGLYDPASGFRLIDSKMAQARHDQTITALLDGTVLIAGGSGLSFGDKALSSAELFRP
jgi:hypothetical protein